MPLFVTLRCFSALHFNWLYNFVLNKIMVKNYFYSGPLELKHEVCDCLPLTEKSPVSKPLHQKEL